MIPIYRGKKINSDEWIESETLIKYGNNVYLVNEVTDIYMFHMVVNHIKVDPDTLGINFENMIDKNGKKIFASLSEDGVGGDEYINGDITTIACVSHGNAISPPFYFDMSTLEVIGIHKGES